jgi:uncharacterized protein
LAIRLWAKSLLGQRRLRGSRESLGAGHKRAMKQSRKENTEMTIIDFHVHLFENEITHVNGIPTKTSKGEIIESMEEAGIDLSVLIVMASKNDFAKTKERNDWLAKICQEESRFEGFGSVHPEDGQDAIDEMKRCVNELGLKGFKLHPNTQQFDCSEPGLVEVMKQAAELDVPVIIDS